jgi:hypothetical protein
MKADQTSRLVALFSSGGLLSAMLCLVALMGCAGTCPVITHFAAEPQWVCPGQDFSPKIHFRIENYDEDGDRSSDGTCLWGLWETSKGAPNQPGSVALTSKVGSLKSPGTGIHETPAGGVHVVGGAQTSGYRFSLIASNTECDSDGEKYLKNHQEEIEDLFGVDLDDNAVMTAHAQVVVISAPTSRMLCIPHALDVQAGFTWIGDEVRAGKRIVIDGLVNTNPFSVQVKHVLPPPHGTKHIVLQPRGTSGASTTMFDGQSPNGKWAIKAVHDTDYQDYIQHGLKYVGKPPICVQIGLCCK